MQDHADTLRWCLGLVASLIGLLTLGCGNTPDDGSVATPLEQLESCGLPEACTSWTTWDGCADYQGQTYGNHDVCTFEALLGESATVVRGARFEPICGDIMEGVEIHVYRWADGSMTCALEYAPEHIEVHACALPDTSTVEACLDAALAGEEVTETCLDFDNWGLELGAEIEPACGPT